MTLGELKRFLDEWAPAELAWERDNVGIQIGSARTAVRKALVALDVTDEVVAEAVRVRADLIVSHHPMYYHPLRRVAEDERTGRLTALLLRRRIAVLAAHTNLDFAPNGVSAVLARRLGVANASVLRPAAGTRRKIAVFVPPAHAERVRTAMAAAGAGVIGRYGECSFAAPGTGTFVPLAGARPFIGSAPPAGKRGSREEVREVRLEMALPRWRTAQVVAAMKRAHPYEEAAFDLYDTPQAEPGAGAGMIGELAAAQSARAFLARVRRSLGARALRVNRAPSVRRIRRVAVCGGAGSDLLADAVAAGAEAFVTADVGYHRFEEADGRLLLVDAGHYETEAPVVAEIARYLSRACAPLGVRVAASTVRTNFASHYS